MIRVKICGVTRVADALAAADLGVHALGLNFHPGSPRFVTIEQARAITAALPPGVDVVGVFVDASVECIRETAAAVGFSTVQLHGSETPETARRLAPYRLIRAFRWRDRSATEAEITAFLTDCDRLGAAVGSILLDTHRAGVAGGTGVAWNWTDAAAVDFGRPLLLAGGLKPENAAAAVRALRPAMVDVASGVESAPGVKDHDRMRAFVEAVQSAGA
ncbi:MAG: phosphoribosylanthranilate isomerase [Planctomycetia bacterium]